MIGETLDTRLLRAVLGCCLKPMGQPPEGVGPSAEAAARGPTARTVAMQAGSRRVPWGEDAGSAPTSAHHRCHSPLAAEPREVGPAAPAFHQGGTQSSREPTWLAEVAWQEEEAWGRAQQWPGHTPNHSTPHHPSSVTADQPGCTATRHERTPPLSGSLLSPSLPWQQCWALGTQALSRHGPALGVDSQSFIYSARSV